VIVHTYAPLGLAVFFVLRGMFLQATGSASSTELCKCVRSVRVTTCINLFAIECKASAVLVRAGFRPILNISDPNVQNGPAVISLPASA